MANHGLFIGIDYRGTQNALRGCVNDTKDWADALKPALASTTMLLESAATKAGIVAGIRDLLARLQPGDTGIITFSGHGTQVPDRQGAELDGEDEAMCPFDLQQELLLDDEVRALLRMLPPSTMGFFVADCCHSGTMTRVAGIGEYHATRSLPWDVLTDGMSAVEINSLLCRCRQTPKLVSARGESDLDGVVFLSGCKDDEVSYDATFGGRANGAMTYFALQTYRTLPKGATFGEWYERIRQQLPSRKYPQTPYMSDEGREWFVPGFEPNPAPAPAPPVVAGGPGVDVVVGGWRAKTWERVQ